MVYQVHVGGLIQLQGFLAKYCLTSGFNGTNVQS